MKIVELGFDVDGCGKCGTYWFYDKKGMLHLCRGFFALLESNGFEYGYIEIEQIKAICQMCTGNGEIEKIKIPSLDIKVLVCDTCDACWAPNQSIRSHTSQTLSSFLKNHNLEYKDIIKEGKRILCPACEGHGEVHKITIGALNIQINLCDECETYWDNEQRITSKNPKCFMEFLDDHGLDYTTAQIEKYW
jgi:NMD protein affecting ribosome stability and mRNA decay